MLYKPSRNDRKLPSTIPVYTSTCANNYDSQDEEELLQSSLVGLHDMLQFESPSTLVSKDTAVQVQGHLYVQPRPFPGGPHQGWGVAEQAHSGVGGDQWLHQQHSATYVGGVGRGRGQGTSVCVCVGVNLE